MSSLIHEVFSDIRRAFGVSILSGCVAVVWYPIAALIGTIAPIILDWKSAHADRLEPKPASH